MTITVFPVDAVDTNADAVADTPTYTGQMARQALSVLFGKPPAGRPLGATSGVRQGTSTATVTATSSTWTVNPHSGVMDVEVPAAAGAYLYAIDTAVTGSMSAPHATNQRVDSIFLQLSDPAESDGSSVPGLAVVYATGTPGTAGGARGAAGGPPVIPARAMEIAQIVVPHVGAGSPAVTWVAPVAFGSIDTGWISLAGTVGNSNTSTSILARRVGKVVSIIGSAVIGSAITVGVTGNVTNTTMFTITDPLFIPSVDGQALGSGNVGPMCSYTVQSNGAINLDATVPVTGGLASTVGVSWAGTYLVD